MKTRMLRPEARVVASLALGVATSAVGQTVPTTSISRPGEVVELSPFTVNAERDTGYRATNTLSGTRINTSLRDIAASIQAITPEFLEDAGLTNDTELLQYTTSTEVAGGAGGNFYGDAEGTTAFVSSDDNRRAESAPTRIRGMTSAARATSCLR